MADEALGAQRVVGACERGAVVGLGGADRGDLDGPGGDSQELLGEDVALVDARDAGAHLDRRGVGHVGGGDVGGVGRPRAVGRLVLDQDVVAVGVGGGGGAGRVGLSVVGLHDVGGLDRHVAGDAGGRDEERAGGVLDGVVGRGVGAVGRQDAGLPREGAGVAGVGVGQRALGGVCQLEGLAVGQAHGLDAADLLLGAGVGKRGGLALEGDGAVGHLEGAGMRSSDDVALGHIGETNGILVKRRVVLADLGALGTRGDAPRIKLSALGVAGKASNALLGAVVGEAGRFGSKLDVLVVVDKDVHLVLRELEHNRFLEHRCVSLDRDWGLRVFRAPCAIGDDLGPGDLFVGICPQVVNDVGLVGTRRPLGGEDVLGALVEIVDDNLLASFKDAAVRGEPTGEHMSRRAMRHGSRKAQVIGAG